MKAYLKILSTLLVKLLVVMLLITLAENTINANTKQKKKTFVVVIDPGHGGKDPGAVGKLTCEKDVVLRIALILGKLIKQHNPEIKVVYTRDTDVFIELNERAAIANRNKADLFISIHTNSSANKKPYGIETFLMGESKSDENLEVAKMENAVILKEDNYTNNYGGYDPNAPETFMIMSLIQNTYHNQSLNFANEIHLSFKRNSNRFDRGIKQAGFLVLWKTAMPSVLIETGFISNINEERKILNTEKGCEEIAQNIHHAFKKYLTSSHTINSISQNYNEPENEVVENPIIDTVFDMPIITDTTISEINTERNTLKDSTLIMFYVQLQSTQTRTSTNSSNFKNIKNVEEINIDNTYKYVVGRNSNYSEVAEYSKKIKRLFPDAFVIAVQNNKIIPLNEALKEIKN